MKNYCLRNALRGASLAAALLAAAPALAESAADLYTAVAITTGSDTRYRAAGFAQCLREVLVKVSGNPGLAQDPRVATLAEHADRLIVAFDYVDQMAGIPRHDEQGTYDRPHNLTVHFDPARIDAALAELGERPWRGERPVIVPALLVRGLGPPFAATYLLAADEPAASVQRDAFRGKAQDYAQRVRFPSAGELAAWHIDTSQVPEVAPEAPAGEAVVAGVLEFRPAYGWTGQWRLRWQGADYAWRVEGVNFDKAFESIVRGVVRVASGHGAPQ